MTVLERAMQMRAAGRPLKEIGGEIGVTPQTVFRWFKAHGVVGHNARLWDTDNAAELKTWLAVRGELHVHHEREKRGQSRWMLVERRTEKCGTRRCLRVPTR